MEGGVGQLQAHALLLVLLQSQRVDGEEGHVGLQHKTHRNVIQTLILLSLLMKTLRNKCDLHELCCVWRTGITFVGLWKTHSLKRGK